MSNCCSEKIYNLRDKDFDARGNIIKGLPFMLGTFSCFLVSPLCKF